MMKIKKGLLSFALAAAMLFTSACSQGNENVELGSDSNTAVTVSEGITTVSEETSGVAPVTVATEESTPTETVSEETSGTTAHAANIDTTVTAATVAKPVSTSTTAKTAAATVKPVSTTTAKSTVTAASTPKPTVTTTTAPYITTTAPFITATTPPITTTPPPVTTTTTAAPVQPVPISGFKVSGTKLLDANGNEFIIRGINHPHVWFRNILDQALQGIANTGANCVRVVLGDGNPSHPDWATTSESEIKTIIQKCKEKNLICILEVHNATGSKDVLDLSKSVEYWESVKNTFIGEEKYVIINIANEWYGTYHNLDIWGNAYADAVKTLRSAGIHNTIMVDAAGWGQSGESVHKFGEKVLNADPEKNTMFSIHMYGVAGGNQEVIKSNIDNTLNKNLCLVIGEFGFVHGDLNVDEDYIMKYCTEMNVGYIAWSWKGNSNGILDMSYDWEGNNLTEWGKNVVYNEYGIKKTSKICTVF